MTLNLLCYDLGAGGQHVQSDAPSVRALDEGELLRMSTSDRNVLKNKTCDV